MKHRMRARVIGSVLLSLLALTLALRPAPLTLARSAPSATGGKYLTSFINFYTAMTRNFNPFSPSALDFTLGGIYEPLMIMTTAGGGRTYPWLATAYKWVDGNRTLLITIRHGVRWSDGQPFTAKDVLFTFTYGKINAGADQIGDPTGNVKSVNLVGSDQVAVHFKTVDTTALQTVLNNVKILPAHIWSKVKNPITFTNPNPVGTGPFTQIVKFTSQGFILGKNPYYWQPGKPAFDGIRVPLYTGNDPANLSMVHGELDWTGNFVPNIQKVYVQKDPVHFHYFYAANQVPQGIFFNDEKYPFSLVAFRKAISYAIDRQKVWQIGEYGYETASDAIGVANVWPAWVDKSLEPQAKELATYNPTKAKALLARSGFTWKGGQLYDPRGHRVAIQLSTPSGWTDSVLDLQIMQRELQAIGIDASVKLMDYAGWIDKTNRGLLSASFPPQAFGGVTPYYLFNSYMSRQSYVPTGQDASAKGNLERWWSPQATALLAQFRQTTDTGTQRAIVDKLQKIQLDAMPYIPVVYGVYWYTYSTLRFAGWPTPSNYYAIGSPWQYPDDAKVMTTITPAR